MIRQCTGTEHFLFIRLIITCWSSADFTIHVPSSWPHHHHSNRVSMASIIKWACFPRGLKDSKTNSLVSDDGYLQVSRKKKLHVQLAYEGDQFKKGKNVSLLCCCHILVCHTKKTQMIHGSIMRKYKWNRQTDRHTANSMSFKSKPTDWDTCISKHVILSTKKGIGMYKCTRKLQLHQNIFKPCPQLACCKIIKE